MTELTTFETQVQVMLHRQAATITDEPIELHPAGQPDRGDAPRIRWVAIGAVAAAIVIAGVAWATSRDDVPDATVATSGQPVPSAAVPENVPEEEAAFEVPGSQEPDPARISRPNPNAEWGTSIPSEDQFPQDFVLGAASPVLWLDGTLDDVVDAYLRSRLPDGASLGLGATPNEVMERFALYRWQWGASDANGEAGWLYLRFSDGRWAIVAATTDSLDANNLIHGSQGLQGTVRSSSGWAFVLEALRLSTEDLDVEEILYQSSEQQARLDIDTLTGGQQVWVRVQHQDGAPLSITEFQMPEVEVQPEHALIIDATLTDVARFDTRLTEDARILRYAKLVGRDAAGEYQNRLRRDVVFIAPWEQATDPVVYLLGIEEAVDIDELLAELRLVEGVSVVEGLPQLVYGEQESASGDVVVTESGQVDDPPIPFRCQAGVGIEVPPNRTTVVQDPIIEETAQAALRSFLAGPGPKPPRRSGFEELTTANGTVFYTLSVFMDIPLAVIRTDRSNGGYAVTQWEISGC